MVAHTFKITDGMKYLCDISAVRYRQGPAGQLDQVGTQVVLINVYLVLQCSDLLFSRLCIVQQVGHRSLYRLQCQLRHL